MRGGLSLKSLFILIALLVASGAAAVTAATSAEPSEGTISVESPPVTWTGTVDLGIPLGQQCTPPFNLLPTGTCDTFELTADIEGKYWEAFDGGVQVVVAPEEDVDLDFRVYDASGAVVASAENAPAGGTEPSSETATIPEPDRDAGPYQIVVFSFGLLSGPDAYNASARLDARASAPTGGGTPDAPIPTEIVSDAPCVDGVSAGVFPCENVDLKSFMPISEMGGFTPFETGIDPTVDELINDRLNDIWGWTDPTNGKEYAIVGKRDGTSFVDVSDPSNPVYLGSLPTRFNIETPIIGNVWRDIKVYENHAYIVAEEMLHGMQVFDLTQLRGLTPSPPFPLQRTFTETATYDEIGNTHNISINEETGFAYLIGTNTCDGGSHIVDINEPTEPAFAGCVAEDGYTHDNQCVVYDGPDTEHEGQEICFDFNEDTLTIVDVTEKDEGDQIAERPQLSRLPYSDSAYTHQGWLTPDQKYVLMNDELDETDLALNTTTRIVDVRDLDNPVLIGVFDHGVPSIDHNNYVKNSTAYQSNYRSGLRILDIRKIAESTLTQPGIVRSGFFDVFPADDAAEFNGTWSNYPYFESGNIIVSGIEQGLFVLRPTAAAGGKDGRYPGEPGDVDAEPPVSGTPTPTPTAVQPDDSGLATPTPTATTGPGVTAPPSCAADGFASARVRGRKNGSLRLDFARNQIRPVTVDVFQQTAGRRVLGGRLVARYKGRSNGVTWPAKRTRKGKRVRNGIFVARFRMKGSVRRIALKRKNGRFKVRPAFHRPANCGVVRKFQLNRPVFGAKKALGVAFALGRAADVRVTVARKGRVVATLVNGTRPAGRTLRAGLKAKGLPRGDYRVRIQATTSGGERVASTLVARRH